MTKITAPMAKSIAEARASGMTWRGIMAKFDISEETARRYGDPSHVEKRVRYERTRYLKSKIIGSVPRE